VVVVLFLFWQQIFENRSFAVRENASQQLAGVTKPPPFSGEERQQLFLG